MGSGGDMLTPCKRGHVARRDRKNDCVVCKKMRDDRHRENARLAGKDAARQLAWWHKRMGDPEFREKQRIRSAERNAGPARRVTNRLGVRAVLAREIVDIRDCVIR